MLGLRQGVLSGKSSRKAGSLGKDARTERNGGGGEVVRTETERADIAAASAACEFRAHEGIIFALGLPPNIRRLDGISRPTCFI